MSPLRIHATNLGGMGARRVVEGLLPALLDFSDGPVEVFLTKGDPLAEIAISRGKSVTSINRTLPHAASRLFEVTLGADQYRGDGNLLVLGDLPLSGVSGQTVLVHNRFSIDGATPQTLMDQVKSHVSRSVFAINQKFVGRFIVQTQTMADGLAETYGIRRDRIDIIGQPPPEAIRGFQPKAPKTTSFLANTRLRLFYPSRQYPHKRHDRLTASLLDDLSTVVDKIVLTVDEADLPQAAHPKLQCIGEVQMDRVVKEYSTAHALLFLSDFESYGLPLLEALWLDLPGVCPDLPYARDILGENDFFFTAGDPASLARAVHKLHQALSQGWRADWRERRDHFPPNWREVALRFLSTVRQRS